MIEIPVLTIVAKSKSGKTTLMVKLITILKQRGYRIAAVKHHSHAGFEIDTPGKDSWRFGQAGSDQVVIAAPDKIASYRRLDRELSLDEVLETITNVDLILVEGYKRAGKPALEVVRAAVGTELITDQDQLVAVAADVGLDVDVPQFKLDDADAIADFIEKYFFKEGK